MAQTRSFFKLIYVLKKLTDNWGDQHLQAIRPEFKMAYMPVFICVSQGITSNVAIAKELHITKMAVSKMITGLTELNLLSSTRSTSDGRSLTLSLTEPGAKFLKDVVRISSSLEDQYKGIIGGGVFDELLNTLSNIQDFHESKLRN